MLLIVGVGYMGKEYARVLKAQNQEFMAVGNSPIGAKSFSNEFDVDVRSGGIEHVLKADFPVPDSAIVCAPVELLAESAKRLIEFGVKKILVEKPGGLSIAEVESVELLASEYGADVLVAYNRRFYQSVRAIKRRLESEELIAVNFELTEWSHLIVDESCSGEVKQKWFLANTSHVVDLAFNFSGKPLSLTTHTAGKGSLKWHESASRFVGSGVTEENVLLSYCGYWDGPGRWSVEVVTTQNRYVLRPMEILQVQPLGSVAIEAIEAIDYSLDEKYKPGLYLMTEGFLSGQFQGFSSFSDQVESYKLYYKMASY